jgi:hypothetical protein
VGIHVHRASGGGNSNPQPAKRPRANRAKRSCGGCEAYYDSVTRHASQQNLDHRRVITGEPSWKEKMLEVAGMKWTLESDVVAYDSMNSTEEEEEIYSTVGSMYVKYQT